MTWANMYGEREDATFNKNDTVTFNYGYNMRSLAKET